MEESSNKRIIKNSAMLFFRMLITMGISLYSSRIILENLGIEDYGTYNAVGSFVAMFGFINSSMTACTMRYLTHALGKGDNENLMKTFSTSLIIHIIIALIITILAETVGLWFIQNKLEIAPDSRDIAMWVYQISIITTIIMIISVPYNAVIVAHEKMSAFAYISVIDVLLRLFVALSISLFTNNKLIIYAILLLLIQLIIRLIYGVYCHHNFIETRGKLYFNRGLAKEMFSFATWDLYGNFSTVVRTQGVAILLYNFFGAVSNAASAISSQIQGTVMQIVNNVIMAVRPQIIKSYSAENFTRMNLLIERGTIFSFLLMVTIATPIMVELPTILKIWLVEIPEYTIVFCRTTLIFSAVTILSMYLSTGVHATGNVKRVSFINGTLYISVIPLAYIAYKLNAKAEIAYILNIFTAILGVLNFAWTLHIQMQTFSFSKYMKNVFIKCIIIITTFLITVFYIRSYISNELIGFVISFATSILLCIVTLILTTKKEEKQLITKYIRKWRHH